MVSFEKRSRRPSTRGYQRATMLGGCVVFAAFLGSCGDRPTPAGPDASAMSLVIVRGNAQTAAVGTELAEPLVVKATTARGFPLPLKLLNFVVVEGDGKLYAGSSITNLEGIAQDYLTLGPRPGRNVVEVRAVDPHTGAKQLYATFIATGTPVPVAAVAVSAPATSVEKGRTLQMSAVLTAANGTVLTGADYPVTWSSSDETIARVSATGLLTGVAVGGPVTITATSGGVSGTASISVFQRAVHSITVQLISPPVVVGGTGQVRAQLSDINGVAITDEREIEWSSSDENVATVGSTGEVTGVAGGSVTISALSEGRTGSTTITIQSNPNVVASIVVTRAASWVGVGSRVFLTATLRNAAGVAIGGAPTVQWSASDASLVSIPASSVANNGQAVIDVFGIAGNDQPVTITASVGAVSASTTVEVVGRWGIEPNESQSDAAVLTTVTDVMASPGVTATGNFHTVADKDWYRIRASEASSSFCIPGADQKYDFRVDLTSVPSGSDYDLFVHHPSSGQVFSSAVGGNSSEAVSLTLTGVCGEDDSFDFSVEVRRFIGDPTNRRYQLSFSLSKRD